MIVYRIEADRGNSYIEIAIGDLIKISTCSENKLNENSIYLTPNEWKKIKELLEEML